MSGTTIPVSNYFSANQHHEWQTMVMQLDDIERPPRAIYAIKAYWREYGWFGPILYSSSGLGAGRQPLAIALEPGSLTELNRVRDEMGNWAMPQLRYMVRERQLPDEWDGFLLAAWSPSRSRTSEWQLVQAVSR